MYTIVTENRLYTVPTASIYLYIYSVSKHGIFHVHQFTVNIHHNGTGVNHKCMKLVVHPCATESVGHMKNNYNGVALNIEVCSIH